MVAPSVTLSGNLNASGGGGSQCGINGSPTGVIRIEAFQVGSINASGNYYTATPFGLFLTPAGIPSVRVVSIGGNPVNTTLTGAFIVSDVMVNSNGPLQVVIQATNVPTVVGTVPTVVTLVIFSENGPDQPNITSTPLSGTLASSTATAMVTLPPGFSKGFVKATFTQ